MSKAAPTMKLTGPPGIFAAFLWGFAEATLFFVVPDVLLSLAALFAFRRAWRHVLAAIAGALLGGALLYTWSTHSPTTARNAVAHVPFVTARMIARVHTGYEQHPVRALILGPLSGIPYKLYAAQAPPYLSAPIFLAATIPARGERFVLVWLFFGALGTWLRRFPAVTPQRLVILHASVWFIFYLFYWGRILLH
jgi:membrane protein YqaA with SNARE-associated domain